MLTAWLLGFVFGFVFSMPVAGPVSILVFGRGLEDRAHTAVYLAIGSALAESAYAYLAFWGFGELLKSHSWIEPISRGVAAVLLTGLGLRLALKQRGATESGAPVAPEPAVGRKRSFLLGLTITALNPTLIATWGLVMTGLHSFNVVAFDTREAVPFSLGVCMGISAWFTVLLGLLRRYRGRFARSTLDRTVRFMGMALTLLGLFFAYRFVSYMQHGA